MISKKERYVAPVLSFRDTSRCHVAANDQSDLNNFSRTLTASAVVENGPPKIGPLRPSSLTIFGRRMISVCH
jgi:hypothetical protein